MTTSGARRQEPSGALSAVHRCSASEALVIKGLLESHGIPAILRARLAHSVHPFTVGAQGEVVILVPTDDLTHATLLVARIVPEPPLV
jgi:hypothetical protein